MNFLIIALITLILYLFLSFSQQEKAGSGFLAGPTVTYADISVFCYLSFLMGGMFAGGC